MGESALVDVTYTEPNGDTDDDQFATVLDMAVTAAEHAIKLAIRIDVLTRYFAWAVDNEVFIEPEMNNRHINLIKAEII